MTFKKHRLLDNKADQDTDQNREWHYLFASSRLLKSMYN